MLIDPAEYRSTMISDLQSLRRGAAPTGSASGFLLSVLSPVWRAKLCGDLGGETRRELALEDGEAGLFSKLVALACGVAVTMDGGLEEVVALGRMADRYQVEVVEGVVEDAVVRLLTVENCGRVLEQSSGSGLVRVEKASRELALRRFDDFSTTAGFMEVGEEVLGSLLDDDELQTEREERVYEGAVRWIKGGAGGSVRGAGLLKKVRLPYMGGEYLADLWSEVSQEVTGLDGLLSDALALKSKPRRVWGTMKLRHLDARTLVARKGFGVRWEEYVGGGERRLRMEAGQVVYSVTADDEYVYAGLEDGVIRVWSRSTLEDEKTLLGHTEIVWALLTCGVQLISCSSDHDIRVWVVGSGRCESVLQGHTGSVSTLAASTNVLLSGSDDGTLRVWRMEGDASTWRCVRTLPVEGTAGIFQLAAWDGVVAAGCVDGAIRVWSTETWGLEQTLRGHEDDVMSLVVNGRRLISSSYDGTLRVWSTETWACLQTVQVYEMHSEVHINALAVSGSTLAGVSNGGGVLVWDLETLEQLHTLDLWADQAHQPSLKSYDGEVWGAIGEQVVVWGRRG
jgi:WD40 repeat protein